LRASSPERSQRQRKELPKFDAVFEELTEDEELTKKEGRAAWNVANRNEVEIACRRLPEGRTT
jgi:hypothetical protein